MAVAGAHTGGENLHGVGTGDGSGWSPHTALIWICGAVCQLFTVQLSTVRSSGKAVLDFRGVQLQDLQGTSHPPDPVQGLVWHKLVELATTLLRIEWSVTRFVQKSNSQSCLIFAFTACLSLMLKNTEACQASHQHIGLTWTLKACDLRTHKIFF